jgi:quinol-cytochrome oxidoreductase complex cytochrome b subunit
MSQESAVQPKKRSADERLVEWFMARFGLRATVLRPVPEFTMNPFYWLGALATMAFVLQVVTGLLMLIYYVPTTDQAYTSTLFIIKYVPLGWLLETTHLYGAYAMILLTFLHLFRGYFMSVQKKPREMMWIVGMGMGLMVLGFGLTGYLLTWTVVSKSATDVSIGMMNFLPAQLGSIIIFLIAGSGSGAAELTRFFDLHIVVLPAGLLALLVLKMYMFEAHGAADPATGHARESPRWKSEGGRELPWFPSVYLYIAMIGAAFVAIIFVASALFPITLAPEFTPLAASTTVPQPEWYFLWIYQFVKIAAFEGSGIYYSLGIVTVAVLGLVLLPFIDRSERRNPAVRPVYVTVGLILIGELLALTVWGYYTPGEIIPNSQALVLLVGVAVAISVMTSLTYRARRRMTGSPLNSPRVGALALPFTHKAITGLFLLPLAAGSVFMANAVNVLTSGSPDPLLVSGNLVALLVSFYLMLRILKTLTIQHRRSLA